MDLGYNMDLPYRSVPPDLAGPAERIASFLGGGGRAVVVTGPPRSGKRALLDGLLTGMPGRVTRLENRSGETLALDRVLAQMGKVADAEGDERGLFFRTLAEQAYDDYSAVIAVEDAHSLSSFALAALGRVPGLGGPDRPGMILVLSGEASLLKKLDAPGLEVLRNSRRTLHVSLTGPVVLPEPLVGGAVAGNIGPSQPAALSSVAAAVSTVEPSRSCVGPEAVNDDIYTDVGWSHGPLGGRAVTLALVLGLIAAGGLALSHRRPAPVEAQISVAPLPAVPATAIQATAPTPVAGAATPEFLTPAALEPPASPAAPSPGPAAIVDATSERTQAAAVAQAGAPAVAPTPGPPQGVPDALSAPVLSTEAQVRQEFDTFLDRAGKDTATLTPAARETLFLEYKQWRARTAVEARSP